MNDFDDFLDLRARDFSRVRLAVFEGRSGSGKSTAIRFLLDEHRDFRGREAVVLERASLRSFRGRADVLAIDDLVEWREVGPALDLLRRSRTLLVAAHLPLWSFLPARLIGPCALFSTDRDRGKIQRALARRGIPASSAAVTRYVAAFGATYTDLEIILERCPLPTFDAALARFSRLCTLEAEP